MRFRIEHIFIFIIMHIYPYKFTEFAPFSPFFRHYLVYYFEFDSFTTVKYNIFTMSNKITFSAKNRETCRKSSLFLPFFLLPVYIYTFTPPYFSSSKDRKKDYRQQMHKKTHKNSGPGIPVR